MPLWENLEGLVSLPPAASGDSQRGLGSRQPTNAPEQQEVKSRRRGHVRGTDSADADGKWQLHNAVCSDTDGPREHHSE